MLASISIFATIAVILLIAGLCGRALNRALAEGEATFAYVPSSRPRNGRPGA